MATKLYLSSATDSIQFNLPDDYIVTTGLRGFGIPSPILRIDPSASNGGTFRYSKRDVREIDLPVTIIADSESNLQTKLRRLANILQGKATLQATLEDGTNWYLNTYYAGGGETTFGATANTTFCQWDIILRAPQPFWQSDNPFEASIIQDSSTRGLLAGTSPKSLAFLRVKTSQAFGSVSIFNDGDVDAPATWVINGPSTLLTIQRSDGVGFTYTTSMSSSDTLYIDCEAGTVVDQNGVNKYAGLGAAPKLFSLPPGINYITITVSGASSATKVRGTFMPRREVLH